MIIVKPEKLLFPIKKTKITNVSCGWNHCVFLSGSFSFKKKIIFFLEENLCFGKGKSQNGEIPMNTIGKYFFKNPVEISTSFLKEEIITEIFCGFRQTFLLTNSNIIYCSGYNKFLELGIPNLQGNYCYFSLQKNEFFRFSKAKIKKIETGQKFTCFLDGF